MFGRRRPHGRHGQHATSAAAWMPVAFGAVTAGALAAGIALASGPAASGALPDPVRSPEPVRLDDASPVALHTGQTCESLLAHYRRAGRDEVTAWGLGGGDQPFLAAASGADMGVPEAGSAPRATPAPRPDATRSETGTTVQVAGVDEADLAKRSGDLLLVLKPGVDTFLHVVRTDAATGTARQVGSVELTSWPTSLLVEGDTVLVIGSALTGIGRSGDVATDSATRSMIMPWKPLATRLDQVDISDPARPRLVTSLVVDATVAGARMVDGVAQLALTSRPSLVFSNPPDARLDEKKLLQRNRRIVDDSTIEDWLPAARVSTPDGATTTQPLLECNEVAVPASPAGVTTLTLLSADLRAGGLADRRTTAVVASGTTVYADAEQTVVAMSQARSTALHMFARAGRVGVRYVASGTVPGQVLNQFSIDAYEGYLRVATTEESLPVPWPMPPAFEESVGASQDGPVTEPTPPTRPVVAPSQSRVTVLRRDGARLVSVGAVDGLGTGERIYAVRFLGDLAYVVTFRRTDPLYVIDLSDPAAPRTAGELKIPGYSAYLQPAGEGQVLGLGQDADLDGRVKGLQLSLFDVSEPSAPQRIAQLYLPNAFSEAEFDHHAFTLADGLVLVPYSKNASAGLVATRLDGRRLGEPTLLRRGQVAPQRSFVDGGHIWSVGTDGVVVYDASTLEQVSRAMLS